MQTLSAFWLALTLLISAFPQAGNDKPASPDVEANAYAQNLDYTINAIIEDYFRPVSRADLVAAALTGLFEEVQVPVPPSLNKDIQATKDDQGLHDLVKKVRLDLGDREALKGTKGLVASIRSMCKSLDPHTALMTKEELDRTYRDETHSGFGLECAPNTGSEPVQIKNVLPGSPGQKAGLRPGDLITLINNRPPDPKALLALSLSNLLPYVAEDQPGTSDPLELTIQRPSTNRTWKVQLTPETFQPETIWGVARKPDNHWDFMLDRTQQIALVRVGLFAQGTSQELEEVLTRLQAEGVRGLILDLRWCPGGFLTEAVASARLFLGEDLIARIKTRRGDQQEYRGKRDMNFLNFPMVVLVNGQSSGGAELIAAALQDNHRALLAGQRTLGKASVQTTKVVTDARLTLKLTSGTFIRPSGKNLHRFPNSSRTDDWGVLPDAKLEFRISSDLDRRLREWYQLQTLRPGSSKEVLPLDDPAADPQRQAARKYLADTIKQSQLLNTRVSR